ncbi:MAG: ferrous iron transport protein B [Candidatus Latescibacteria bacterium]|nr:ferrous iron transport protein B [Candidatus Latescibacterota bacterium]NIO00957.1 ferrous iron transport protein B [Candidatus Latescibacterota bacterium]NIO27356.1 ferrous iron transport protein B [Candidatus Latescibacterota bacterium]NIO54878.1 ferrous iron transport protein B [Candidatus Latescibacterota bacterium]NIT00967.1 ferrous iron transport protein B [Candidatus Latescibacterota bacterium]
MTDCSTEACATCPAHHIGNLVKLGVDMKHFDYVVALAGNPNTGKSTVFNAITGLRQHTGNWPGKTVTRAEGGFSLGDVRYKLVDLPGTYSLLSASVDEEIARDFILFGQPDVTVVVVDANHLERNLNLVLQVLEITDRAVVCLNLIDEAKRHGRSIDPRRLSRDLGVPVVPTIARENKGIDELLEAIAEVATGQYIPKPHRAGKLSGRVSRAVDNLSGKIKAAYPSLSNARWVALRLLDGDERITDAVKEGELNELGGIRTEERESDAGSQKGRTDSTASRDILGTAQALRWEVGMDFHDRLMESIYTDAARIAERATTLSERKRRFDLDRVLDGIVTSRLLGFPFMLLLFTIVLWITIAGANIPSSLLFTLLLDKIHPLLKSFGTWVHMPWWLSGFLFDGVYLATAWVVSVMLPPMAIFFPLFTLMEDFGYLARVSFNLDGIFKKAGAHGKQALTMSMGFGCNAAGVTATRIIDSRRERLIAIITNNFALCNGRWPTQILIATIFIGALAPAHLAGLVSAGAVVGVAVLGVVLTFVVSWFLSRTMLRGEPSSFSLELPPYRPPRFWRTLYTSLIDRTIFVLWRAIVFAMPAGAAIWLLGNVNAGSASIAEHIVGFINPFGLLIGLNGVILLAYIVAIPANEIVIPTILMLTVMSIKLPGMGEGPGVMFEMESISAVESLLSAGGWTLLTGLNLMLFSLVHNPCSTTIYTIWKETRSRKWTAVAALLPLCMGLVLCFLVAQIWRTVSG